MEAVLIVLLLIVIALLAVVIVRQFGGRPAAPANGPLLNPEDLLRPVRERLDALQHAVNDSHVKASQTQGTLLETLRQVSEQNRHLYEQGEELGATAAQISTALRGTGVAGDWGELQLRRTIELAGLTEHVSFVEQEHVSGAAGSVRPDVIVDLPNGRRVVIDAKAPLIDFGNTPDAAKNQAAALAAHVKALSNRQYPGIVDNSIDFVVLFVPTEGIMATALSYQPDLSEIAIRQRVLLATPMTLLAMLRAVEYGWKQVAQAENTAHIAKEAAALWDRLATFVDHFNKVGSGLKSAIDNYNSAAGSLERTVQSQARRVRDLGLTVNKELAEPTQLEQTNRTVTWDS